MRIPAWFFAMNVVLFILATAYAAYAHAWLAAAVAAAGIVVSGRATRLAAESKR